MKREMKHGELYGLMAEFLTPAEILAAVRNARLAGYRRMDAYTPYPVEGLAAELGMRRTRIPAVVFIGGLVGLVAGFTMQYYSMAVSYPFNVGGRPFNSWPVFIPIAFEVLVLVAALSAVLGMLFLNRLPELHHPVFDVPAFFRASQDRFFLCIESNDPRFDRQETTQFLYTLNPHGPIVEVPWRSQSKAVYGMLLCVTLLAGCQQQMATQPAYRPLEPSEFFTDGRSARPLIAGTVARGHLENDIAFFTGRRPEKHSEKKEKFIDAFPLPISTALIEHGYHRYMIYCVVCHDPLGTGKGKIVERGYTEPPSYHIDRLRASPIGYLFAVASEGYGSMPSYHEQIPPTDRWAIVAYLRALQASQHFPIDKLPPDVRREWQKQIP